jgi:hypothetical protein
MADEIRYPVTYCYFWIPNSRFPTSGMTDLVLVLQIPSLSLVESNYST